MSEPKYTAIIVTYNSADVIETLLDSIPAAVDHVAIETIVVDNDSSDGTADLVESRSDCTVVRSSNSGYAGGINVGYAASAGRGPILILNPDIKLGPGSVTRLLEALNQSPSAGSERPVKIGIVAPRTHFPDGSLQLTLRRDPTLLRSLGLTFTRVPALSESCNREDEYDSSHVVDWAIGAVMLIRRECFDALGGWEPSFFLFSEEVDFCLRARDAGWQTWYEASAVVEHIGKHSGWDQNLHAIEVVNRVRLYRRRHGLVSSAAYWLLALGGESWNALRGSRIHRYAVVSLLRPSRRPEQLTAPGYRHLLPR